MFASRATQIAHYAYLAQDSEYQGNATSDDEQQNQRNRDGVQHGMSFASSFYRDTSISYHDRNLRPTPREGGVGPRALEPLPGGATQVGQTCVVEWRERAGGLVAFHASHGLPVVD